MSFLQTDRTFREPLSPITTFFMAAFHVGAIAALAKDYTLEVERQDEKQD